MYQKPCWHFTKQRRSQRWLVQLKALWTVLEIKQNSVIQMVYAGTLTTSACTFVTLATMPSEGSHCKVASSSVSSPFMTLTNECSGQVSTLAHKGLLYRPVGIAMHYRTNSFFVTNYGSHSVCKITASGNKPICFSFSSFFLSFFFFFFWLIVSGLMSVHAGSGEAGCQDGLGTSARLNSPYGIAIDQQTDTIYISDQHSIREITLQGMSIPVTTNIEIDVPVLCGCVYVCWFWCHNAHIMLSKGEVSTLAGSADKGDAIGNANGARFKKPLGHCFDEKHQSLLVCDWGNNKLKRVSLKGMLNIAIWFFSARRLHHTSSSFHLILSSSSSWLNLNNRRWIDSVWHTSSNLCDSCKQHYSRLNCVRQSPSSLWSR